MCLRMMCKELPVSTTKRLRGNTELNLILHHWSVRLIVPLYVDYRKVYIPRDLTEKRREGEKLTPYYTYKGLINYVEKFERGTISIPQVFCRHHAKPASGPSPAKQVIFFWGAAGHVYWVGKLI